MQCSMSEWTFVEGIPFIFPIWILHEQSSASCTARLPVYMPLARSHCPITFTGTLCQTLMSIKNHLLDFLRRALTVLENVLKKLRASFFWKLHEYDPSWKNSQWKLYIISKSSILFSLQSGIVGTKIFHDFSQKRRKTKRQQNWSEPSRTTDVGSAH